MLLRCVKDDKKKELEKQSKLEKIIEESELESAS